MSHETPSTVDFSGPQAPSHSPFPIAGYAITGEIAKGGMGRIFAGRDLTLDREVAIKTLVAGANPARFVTEAKITAKLPHPGIPPVHALGTLSDGTPYLAMKLIRGRTLAELLKQRTTPLDDLPRFVQIFEQIAQAVGFAHSQGVIHRDLKPLNVMVGEFGEVQVMDWGLAKNLATATSPSGSSAPTADHIDHTSAGVILGTPGYMAPEQARGEEADARADVFALGSILAAILTGQPAFVGTTVHETIDKAARADLGDVLSRLDQCEADNELRALARRYLADRPEKRPENASLVATDIAAYRAGVAERLRLAEAEKAAAIVRADELRKRRRNILVAAGIIIVLLAAGMFLIDQSRRGEAHARNKAEQAEESRRKQYAQSAFEAGTLALERGNWRGALPLFAAAEEAQFDDVIAIKLQQATAHARLGNLVEVEQLLKELESLELGKHQGRYLVIRAEDDFIGSDPVKGLERMREALASGTLRPGEQAYVEGMLASTFGEAIGKLQQAIELDPYLIEARVMLTSLFMLSGRYPEAELQLNALAVLAPQDPGNHAARAMLFAFQGNLPAAKATLDQLQPVMSAEEIANIYSAFELAASLVQGLDQSKEKEMNFMRPITTAMKLPQFGQVLSRANPRVRHWGLRGPNHPAVSELFKRLTAIVPRAALFQPVDGAFLKVAEIDPDAFFLINAVNQRYTRMNIHSRLHGGPTKAKEVMDELRQLEQILLQAQQCGSISPNVQRVVLYRLIDVQSLLGTQREGFPDDLEMRKSAARNIRQFIRQYPDLQEHELELLAMSSFLIRDIPTSRYVTALWVGRSKGSEDAVMFQMQLEGTFGDPFQSMFAAREMLKQKPEDTIAKEVLKASTQRAENILKEFAAE